MAAGDTLVVPALDQLSRSLQDLITTVGNLRGRGVGFTGLGGAASTQLENRVAYPVCSPTLTAIEQVEDGAQAVQ